MRALGLALLMVYSMGCGKSGDVAKLERALGSTSLVVSQIYGAGGNGGASYTHDYVELFNRGSQAVDIGGWSVQYAPDTSDFSHKVDVPSGTTVPAGGYFLVQLTAGSGGNGSALPTADLSGSINMSASAGKVALVKDTTLLACGATGNTCSSTSIVDLVGYGANASDYEGAAAPTPGAATNALFRKGAGCTDTDNNASDFEVAAAAPRNSATTVNACSTPAAGLVVVSQIYGAGGNSGASYTHDYVELFNRGSQAAAIGGWSVQYASDTNDFSQKVDVPSGTTVPAGGYYLVQLSAGSGGNGSALPTADLVGSINMSASAGKVALVKDTTQLACGATGNACSSTSIADLVGYGATASDYEGSGPAASPGAATNALFRKNGGCTDTDDNAADLEVAAAAPRNSASTANACAAPVDAGVPDSAVPDAAPTGQLVVVSQVYGAGGNSGASYTHDYVELFNRGSQAAAIGGWSVQYASDTNDFSQKVDVPSGTTVPAGGYYLVQLTAGSGGNGSALPTADLVGSINMSASAGKVALVKDTTLLTCGATGNACSSTGIADLVGYGATASDYEGSGPAAAPGAATNALFRKNGGCTDTDDNAADLEVAAAAPRNSASTANACAALVDAGVPDSAVPDAGVPDAGPTGQLVVVSQVYGAGSNSGASYTHDYVELFNRDSQAAAIGGWSVQYASATASFTQKIDIPAGTTLPAGGYYLVQLSGGSNGSALPTADLVGSINMSASVGKVALVKDTTLLTCGATGNACSSTGIADLVGYGATASDHETAAATAPSSAADAMFRKNGGCTDTDNNATDFEVAAAAPRNSAAALNACSAAVPDAAVPDAAPADATVPDTAADGVVPTPDGPVADAPPVDTALAVDSSPAADTAPLDAGPQVDGPVADQTPAPDSSPVADLPSDSIATADSRTTTDTGTVPPKKDDDGCSCNVGARPSPGVAGPLGLGLLALLVVLSRRRR